MSVPHDVQIVDPALIFLLQQRKEDFFLCLKVIVDRRAGERGIVRDLLDRDLLETHRLIQRFARGDDLLFPCVGLFRRTLRHNNLLLSDIILTSRQFV